MALGHSTGIVGVETWQSCPIFHSGGFTACARAMSHSRAVGDLHQENKCHSCPSNPPVGCWLDPELAHKQAPAARDAGDMSFQASEASKPAGGAVARPLQAGDACDARRMCGSAWRQGRAPRIFPYSPVVSKITAKWPRGALPFCLQSLS